MRERNFCSTPGGGLPYGHERDSPEVAAGILVPARYRIGAGIV